jgi:hypothetical protein
VPRPAGFSRKPNYAGVELTDISHFKKTVAKRFGQWLTMILAIAKLGQTRDHCSEVVRISHFQSSKKFCIGQTADSFS